MLPNASHEDVDEVPHLARDEDFLLADEQDFEPSAPNDHIGYTRPYSRVHLAAKWLVLSVPTLIVYDLRTHKVINWNVRPELMKPDRADQTWRSWLKGESANLSISGSSAVWSASQSC